MNDAEVGVAIIIGVVIIGFALVMLLVFGRQPREVRDERRATKAQRGAMPATQAQMNLVISLLTALMLMGAIFTGIAIFFIYTSAAVAGSFMGSFGA